MGSADSRIRKWEQVTVDFLEGKFKKEGEQDNRKEIDRYHAEQKRVLEEGFPGKEKRK